MAGELNHQEHNPKREKRNESRRGLKEEKIRGKEMGKWGEKGREVKGREENGIEKKRKKEKKSEE